MLTIIISSTTIESYTNPATNFHCPQGWQTSSCESRQEGVTFVVRESDLLMRPEAGGINHVISKLEVQRYLVLTSLCSKVVSVVYIDNCLPCLQLS